MQSHPHDPGGLARARSLPCPHCGGIFAIAALIREVVCPFCAHRFALSPAKLAELERYQRHIHGVLGSANAEYRQAAQWQWTEQAHTRGSSFIVYVVFFGSAIFGSFVLQALLMSGVLRGHGALYASYGLVAFSMASAVVTSRWLSGKKRKAEKAGAGTTRVACPSCGAPNELHAGQTLETCRYCHASLVPSGTVMLRAIGQAEQASRAAELARFRAERRAMAAMLGRGTARYYHYIVVGSFLPMTVGAAFVMVGQALVDPRAGNLRAAVAMWLFASLTATPLLYFYVRDSSRRERWRRVADDLAYQFRGQRLTSGMRGVVDWLNTYFAAAYEARYLSSSLYHTALTIDACGYPGLIDIDPAAAMVRHYPARLHIVLAAEVPEPVVSRQAPIRAEAHAAWSWLSAAGFQVHVTRSGLLAMAEPATLEALRREPATAHVLSTVVTTLAGLAHGLGAVPVSAME